MHLYLKSDTPSHWSFAWFVVLVLVLASILTWGLLSQTVRASDCTKSSAGFVPLNDLGKGQYRGFSGGLYPNGTNARPEVHEHAGLEIARSIQPLDRNAQPDVQTEKIVLISVGMSNTTQEFSTFQTVANQDADKNSKLVLVDGAQGGWSADRILANGQPFWSTINQRLASAGFTPQQVQIAWLKEADAQPRLSFPEDAKKLQSELKTIVQMLKQRFSNLKMVYLSSRIYGGYASTNLNPEPYAYQSGFAVKWLIEEQINNSADLNFDASKGAVMAPWLSWGPYLWTDGLKARSDGLIWKCEDLRDDGTHPSDAGRVKVAQMLLKFLKIDPTATPWFLKPASNSLATDQQQNSQTCGTTSADPSTLPLLAKARTATPQRYQFALDRGAQILATPDGRSFSVLWYPTPSQSGSKPPMIVTLHGHGSWAFDEFFIWQPYAAARGYGILALQWWFGSGDAERDYYRPNEMYPIIECLLQAQGIQPGKVLMHGFSRGSAVIYALTALDRSNGKFFLLTVANAGPAAQDYPPNLEIARGAFGATPFGGTHWVMFCGNHDPKPEIDECLNMNRTRDWVKQYGGIVDLFIEDPLSGHGGFHMTPAHVNETLDVFARLLGQ